MERALVLAPAEPCPPPSAMDDDNDDEDMKAEEEGGVVVQIGRRDGEKGIAERTLMTFERGDKRSSCGIVYSRLSRVGSNLRVKKTVQSRRFRRRHLSFTTSEFQQSESTRLTYRTSHSTRYLPPASEDNVPKCCKPPVKSPSYRRNFSVQFQKIVIPVENINNFRLDE